MSRIILTQNCDDLSYWRQSDTANGLLFAHLERLFPNANRNRLLPSLGAPLPDPVGEPGASKGNAGTRPSHVFGTPRNKKRAIFSPPVTMIGAGAALNRGA